MTCSHCGGLISTGPGKKWIRAGEEQDFHLACFAEHLKTRAKKKRLPRGLPMRLYANPEEVKA